MYRQCTVLQATAIPTSCKVQITACVSPAHGTTGDLISEETQGSERTWTGARRSRSNVSFWHHSCSVTVVVHTQSLPDHRLATDARHSSHLRAARRKTGKLLRGRVNTLCRRTRKHVEAENPSDRREENISTGEREKDNRIGTQSRLQLRK